MQRRHESTAARGRGSTCTSEVPPNHPAGLTPASQEQNSLGEKLERLSRYKQTWASACQELIASLCPPTLFPTYEAKRKSENVRGCPSERVNTGRRMPRGPGGPRLFRLRRGGARQCRGTAGSHHPTPALTEVTQSGRRACRNPHLSPSAGGDLLNAPFPFPQC